MTLSTSEQAFLNILEADAVSAFGQPGITLIQALIADKGNLPAQAADLIQFTSAAPKAGITLALELEGQILQMALAKLQAGIAAKAPTTA